MSWIDRRLKKFVCGSLKKVSGKEGFEDSSIYPPRRLDAPEDLGSDKKVFINQYVACSRHREATAATSNKR